MNNIYGYLSILAIYKNTWFIDYRASQHLTFWKEVFSTFEEYDLRDKIYVGDNNPNIDVYEKCTIVFKQPNGIPSALNIYFISNMFFTTTICSHQSKKISPYGKYVSRHHKSIGACQYHQSLEASIHLVTTI